MSSESTKEPRTRVLGFILLSAIGTVGLSHALHGQNAANPSGVFYSKQLDTRVTLVPYGKFYGARLVEDAVSGPTEEIKLEKGDMIISLDNQAITKAADLEKHYALTPIVFVNIRTGRAQRDQLNLPPEEVKPRLTQADVRRAAEQELRKKSVKYQPAEVKVQEDGVWYNLGRAVLNFDTSPAVAQQYRVEIIRLSLSQPDERQFWDPYLQRVEAVISEWLAYINATDALDESKVKTFADRIDAVYDEALKAKAAAEGKKLLPSYEDFAASDPPPERIIPQVERFVPGQAAVAKGGYYEATFLTLAAGGKATVLLMQRTKYLIRLLDEKKRPISDSEFYSFTTGRPTTLSGDYVYKIIYPNGSATPLKTVRIDHAGQFTLR